MSENSTGNVRVQLQDDDLVIDDPEGRTKRIIIPAYTIPALLEFLHSPSFDQSNRRGAFRVPVDSTSGLIVSVHAVESDREWYVTPLNISMTGILLEMREETDLAVHTELVVTLRLGELRESVIGIVRRHQDNRYGIHFSKALSADEARPLDSLKQIVDHIKQDWMARSFTQGDE